MMSMLHLLDYAISIVIALCGKDRTVKQSNFNKDIETQLHGQGTKLMKAHFIITGSADTEKYFPEPPTFGLTWKRSV